MQRPSLTGKKDIQYQAVVAFCKRFGIGYKNTLPWPSLHEDLKRFKDLTKDQIVVMGKDTYFSLPKKHQPLPDRLNIVLTSTPSLYQPNPIANLVFLQENELFSFLESNATHSIVFFIGGQSVYEKYLHLCDTVHVTYIDKEYTCDRFFPFQQLATHHIHDITPHEQFTFLTYKRSQPGSGHADITYQNLLKDILEEGYERDDRTGTGTLSMFGKQLRFNISNSVPLLTTKHIPYKSVIKELLWFLKGDTNAFRLKEQGVNIWNANSTREFLDARSLSNYAEGDIGPMYGFQWRHFGATYEGCDADYRNKGIDQLKNVIDLLKNDPFSRRILMTTVNVEDLEKGCLHPCHGIVVQFYVSMHLGVKHLSCHMYQRSVDTFLGLTWNIFSYAVLTYILAKMTDMKPYELIISTGDTHLYKDHLDQAILQVGRQPFSLPKLVIKDCVKNKSFEDITLDDFELYGYFYHPAIKAKMSA